MRTNASTSHMYSMKSGSDVRKRRKWEEMCFEFAFESWQCSWGHHFYIGSVPGLLFINFSVSKLTQKITRNLMLYHQANAPTMTRYNFYSAMHISAKRGIAIACRLSVCLSVTLVTCDHISWNSSKRISPLVSLGCSLFATPTWRACSKGNTPKFAPKVTHLYWFERRRHSIANCGRMVTDSATVTMESL